MRSAFRLFLACTAFVLVAAAPARAALDPYDVPIITCEGTSTLASITLKICGGASGAPAGLSIHWKKKSDFDLNGWADDGTLCELSLSGQPSLQHPGKSRWELLPGECEDIIIGDLNFDETGLSAHGCGVEPLECGTEYVFRWFAHAGRGFGRSDWGGEIICSTLDCPVGARCTYTQGYWKNHGGPAGCDQAPVNAPDPVWPASVMAGGMDLGANHYTAAQLCTILNESGGGKGKITLAHQLIAANLNLANGAQGCPRLTDCIALANSQIGSTDLMALVAADCTGKSKPAICDNTVPSANACLTSFNEGVLGDVCGPHCSVGPPGLKSGASPGVSTATTKSSWGALKSIYR